MPRLSIAWKKGETEYSVHWLPFGELLRLVLAGDIPHAGSSFAVLALAARVGAA